MREMLLPILLLCLCLPLAAKEVADDGDDEEAAPEALIEQAKGKVKVGDYEGAERLLKGAVKSNAKHVGARRELARIQFNMGRYQEAEATLEAGIALLPASDVLHMEKGYLIRTIALDGPYVGREMGEQVPVKAPAGLDIKGWRDERLKRATECFRKAADVAAEPAQALIDLAYSQRRLGDSAAAAAALKEAAEKEPRNETVFLATAEFQAEAGSVEKAIESCRKALELKPRSAVGHASIAKYLGMAGKKDEAEAERRKMAFCGFLGDFGAADYDPKCDSWVEAYAEDDEDPFAPREGDVGAKRAKAFKEMLETKSPLGAEFLTAILYHRSETAEQAEAAAKALKAMPDLSRAPLLAADRSALRKLRGHRRWAVVGFLSSILVDMKEPGAIEVLAGLIEDDPHCVVTLDATALMEKLADVRAVPFLVKALETKGPAVPAGNTDRDLRLEAEHRLRVRRNAARTLGTFKTDEALQALERGAKSPEVLVACLHALYVQTGKAEHLDALCKEAASKDRGVLAAQALAGVKSPKGCDVLLGVCRDEKADAELRAGAVEALAEMHGAMDDARKENIVKVAGELMQSADAALSEAAQKALVYIQAPPDAK